MPPSGSRILNTSATFPRITVTALKLRIARLGLKRGPYLALLAQNELEKPTLKQSDIPDQEPGLYSKVTIPFTMPKAMAKRASQRAAELETNLSVWLGVLVERDTEDPNLPLIIYPKTLKRL